MKTIYFQPKGINPKFCEAGVIHESDNESICYLSEPCKVSINDVKIISNESVTYDEKNRLYLVLESAHFVNKSSASGLTKPPPASAYKLT